MALQLPEGLLLFATTLADIIEEFTGAETVIMGDVTYGACCVDDFTARALGADFLVHYGHSCLVPVDQTSIKTLYVFVDIKIDFDHLLDTVVANISPETHVAIVSTVQFLPTIHGLKDALLTKNFANVTIPQSHPLSPGEILGCSSPANLKNLQGCSLLLYVGDGRFHLESAMIANPDLKAYKYDPYSRELTEETYDHRGMRNIRSKAISEASHAGVFGLVLGTLGRQGSLNVLSNLKVRHHFQQLTCCLCVPEEFQIYPSIHLLLFR